jgi:hypothetical protein
LLASNVLLAALIVMFDEPSNDTPFMVRAVCRVVAVPAFPDTEPVIKEVKMLLPLKVLLLASSVLLAALIVMFALPLKATPLIVREVWRMVAVPAFPETEPVMRLEKMLFPLNVLLSLKSVVEADPTVIEEPTLNAVPLIVPRVPVR